MRSLLLPVSLVFFSMSAQATTFSVSAGPERWHFTGNQLANEATGMMGSLSINPEKSHERSPVRSSFSINFSSTSAEIRSNSPTLQPNNKATFSLLKFGPEICRSIVDSLDVCGSLGVALGTINQRNWAHNDLKNAYAGIGIQYLAWNQG